MYNIAYQAFFRGRTIGHDPLWGGWHWRGSGFDEGWMPLTEDEVTELVNLIKEHGNG